MDYSPPDSSVHGILQARITEVDWYFLLQGIFLTQGSNPGLLHCRQVLYQLSYQRSPIGIVKPGNFQDLSLFTAKRNNSWTSTGWENSKHSTWIKKKTPAYKYQMGLGGSAEKLHLGASLVVRWLWICLTLQGTPVQSLIREDATCHGATKPMSRNYWACALEPMLCNKRRPSTITRSSCVAMREKPV